MPENLRVPLLDDFSAACCAALNASQTGLASLSAPTP
jgi:hypothetical protein